MTASTTHPAGSLFDFGPSAREYDRWYETPEGKAHDRAQKQDVRRFLHSVRAGECLCDVGCGTGHWSAFFAELGYRVTGIDVSEEMIDVARSRVLNATFQKSDVYDLPFAEGSFDVTAAMATLEFLPAPAEALREMVRCTRSGGRILIGTLNRLAPLNRQRVAEHKPPYASARLFSPGELVNLLAPWGRVRMAASRPEFSLETKSRMRKILERVGGKRKQLQGPFLVAEVRL
ncbi:MAG: class I SAM-dependent methyltransferase [Phycisphaerae bacterium]|nr:class I SAM-dependent methyltransferase [Phycisphaerae bacterium]